VSKQPAVQPAVQNQQGGAQGIMQGIAQTVVMHHVNNDTPAGGETIKAPIPQPQSTINIPSKAASITPKE
jgi:hypothetical protein